MVTENKPIIQQMREKNATDELCLYNREYSVFIKLSGMQSRKSRVRAIDFVLTASNL